jgi:tetratricopeptide (TPR) repeat protein
MVVLEPGTLARMQTQGSDADATIASEDATRRARPGGDPELGRGDTIGRYLILQRIGAGGMGVVYAAFDPELDRRVALKLVRGHLEGTHGSKGEQRLLREAQAMARLSHPNVITVHDAGTCDGGVFVAMEFVEGQTLKQWLEGRKRSWEEIVAIFADAGHGLMAAHAASLVHRDFKPDNVMIGVDGRVRVLDFGLARAFEPGEESFETSRRRDELETGSSSLSEALTRTGAMIGTPAYMAPEQHLGQPTDERSDQFSFCVALYEALYGQRPFAGRSVEAIVLAVTEGELQQAPANSQVPRWLHDVVVRGLAVQPARRHPSMRALLHELERDPGAARKKWMLGGGFALAIGAGMLAIVTARGEGEALCAGGEERIAQVWNEQRAQELSAAFGDGPLAAPTSAGVEAALDAWATRWADGHTEACEATLVRHEQSQILLDRRMACLDDQRRALDAYLAAFTEAGEEGVDKAVAAAIDLPAPERCSDVQALLAEIEPPPAEQQSAVEAVRETLSRSFALQEAGRSAASLAAAREAEAAGDVGYAPLAAEIRWTLGVALDGAGEYEEAAKTIEDALYLARASGHDRVSERATTRLAYLVGHRLGRTEDGERWARAAAAEIERRGDPPEAAAMLASNLGVLRADQSRFDDAVEQFRRAIEIRERAFGEETPNLATALNNLGSVLYMQGDYEGAIEVHRRALEIRERVLGAEHPDVGMSLENMGIAFVALGKHDEAVEHLTRAVAVTEKALGADHPQLAGPLNNLGSALEGVGKREASLASYRRALSITEENLGPDHPRVADSLANLGLTLQDQGDLDEAIRLMERATAIYEAADPEGFTLALTLGNLGGAVHERGDLDQALAHYERSLALKEKLLEPEHPSLAYTLGGMAEVLLDQHRYARALELERRALAIREKANAEPTHVASSQFGLARALAGTGGKNDEARALALTALETYENAGASAEKEQAEVRAWVEARGWR